MPNNSKWYSNSQEEVFLKNDSQESTARVHFYKSPSGQSGCVKMCIESNSGASEVSCINGRGFNFDVVPSLVGIWCPLIFKSLRCRRCVAKE